MAVRKKQKPPPCVHCGIRAGWQARGLCKHCAAVPGVKRMYPPLVRSVESSADLTMEELDAIEAEQRKCLPIWWTDSDLASDDAPRVVGGRVLITRTGEFYEM